MVVVHSASFLGLTLARPFIKGAMAAVALTLVMSVGGCGKIGYAGGDFPGELDILTDQADLDVDAGAGAAADATAEPPPTQPQRANFIFVSEGTLLASQTSTSEADALCASEATDAGLSGTYVAWLSTSTQSAAERVAGARGWIRVDGLPVANDLSTTNTDPFFYPPMLTAFGQPTSATRILTGSDNVGELTSNCSDYQDPGGMVALGSPSYIDSIFSFGSSYSCPFERPVYCVGIDETTDVVPVVYEGRRAFISSPVSADIGRDGADAQCQADADAAGLAGSYLAFLETSSASAASRFDADGPQWVTMTGRRLFDDAGSFVNPPITGIMYTADALPSYEYRIWTGIAPRGRPAGENCQDWSTTDPAFHGYRGMRGSSSLAFGFSDWGCDASLPVFCFQQ